LTHLPQRGQCLFDDAALIHALAAVPLDEVAGLEDSWVELDPSLFEVYNAYYQLGFEQVAAVRSYGIVAVGKERIFAQTFKPAGEAPDAWAIVCHGYYDHIGLYGHLIAELLERNIAVFGFDQIGHGLSTGQQATISDFQLYVRVVEDIHKLGKRLACDLPIHWFGQSMGGALTMEYWQQQKYSVQNRPTGEVVLLAPLVRPYAWVAMRWVFELARRTVKSRPRDVSTNIDNPEFVGLLEQDPLQARTLPVAWVNAMVNWFNHFEGYQPSPLSPKIVHGYEDRTVSYRHNLPVLERLYPQCHIYIVSPARHHLVNETEAIRTAIWTRLDAACQWAKHRGERHAN
jgi:lysophospholipase